MITSPSLYRTHQMFVLDLNKAANSTQLSSIVRMTANSVLSNTSGYFKPGDWLRSLSSSDLMMLVLAMEAMTDSETDPLTEQAMALAVILSQGEGTTVERDMTVQVGYLVRILLMETLARKGLIDINYDNISFGEDAGELQIASLRQTPRGSGDNSSDPSKAQS